MDTQIPTPNPQGYIAKLRKHIRWFLIDVVLGAKDSPHRVALGVAIGLWVALTPTIPFQTGLTLLFCFLFQANKFVGLPVVWITNPLTIVPIYLPLYLFGCLLVGESPQDLNWELLTDTEGTRWEYAERAWSFMEAVFIPLWAGCLVAATLLGFLSYYLTLRWIIKFRAHQALKESSSDFL